MAEIELHIKADEFRKKLAIKDGKDGVPGRDGKDGSDGLSGKDGVDGNDGKDGKDGLDGTPGLDGSPDTPSDVRDKLESLSGNKRLSVTAIKGLDEINKSLEEVKQTTSFLPRTLAAQFDTDISGTQNNDSLLQYSTSTQKWFNGISLTVSATPPTNPKINDLWVDTAP